MRLESTDFASVMIDDVGCSVEPQVLVQLTALLQFLCYVELSNACVTCAKYWWCG